MTERFPDFEIQEIQEPKIKIHKTKIQSKHIDLDQFPDQLGRKQDLSN